MGGACGRYWRDEHCIQNCFLKTWRRLSVRWSRHGWENTKSNRLLLYRPGTSFQSFALPLQVNRVHLLLHMNFVLQLQRKLDWTLILFFKRSKNIRYPISRVGRDRVVGIAARYSLDVRGSNHGGSEIFRTRPNRTTQPPVQFVPGLSRG
jgi:hypothetical protein